MRNDGMKELGTQIVERFHQLDLLTHELLVWIEAFDRHEAWRDEGQPSMPHWLSYRCRISLGTAYEKVRVARKLAELPALSAAVKTGAVTYSLARELIVDLRK